MEALIAGWIAGYVMAMLTTVSATWLVLRARGSELVERWVARDVPGPLLTIPLFTGAVLGWTMIGLVAGSIYEVAGFYAQPDGLGSPSVSFTLAAVTFALLPVALLSVLRGRLWWLWSAHALAFAALFGWLLPHLAGR